MNAQIEKAITVKAAKQQDIQFLRICAHFAYLPYVSRIGVKPAPMLANFKKHLKSDRIDIYSLDDQQIGYAVWTVLGNDLFLENIAFLPAHQGIGAGRFALAHLEQTAKYQGLSAISLYTNEKMTESISFYLSRGFVETDRRREDGFDRIYFRKTVT